MFWRNLAKDFQDLQEKKKVNLLQTVLNAIHLVYRKIYKTILAGLEDRMRVSFNPYHNGCHYAPFST